MALAVRGTHGRMNFGGTQGDVQGAEVIVGEKGKVTGLVAGQNVIVRGKVSGGLRQDDRGLRDKDTEVWRVVGYTSPCRLTWQDLLRDHIRRTYASDETSENVGAGCWLAVPIRVPPRQPCCLAPSPPVPHAAFSHHQAPDAGS
jgi:hypothetical protein